MIHAENLTKRYGPALALDRLTFDIAAGESVALWGSNGAGKTTTLRCLLGVHSFEGRMTVDGVDVARDGKKARALIGYVPQEATFYDMTVAETLAFYARLKKVTPARAAEVLEQVQLEPHAGKSVRALSGGMKQRLALAVALLADPPVLVLDEPTANLDVQAQRDFIATVRALNHAGKTVVFSSHRLEEVAALAQRVLVLDAGVLRADCSPAELAEHIGADRWLRIWVAGDHRAATEHLLRSQGYTFMPNGRTVFVQVRGSKMAPLRSLEAASIPVEDFDLVDAEPPRGHEEHH